MHLTHHGACAWISPTWTEVTGQWKTEMGCEGKISVALLHKGKDPGKKFRGIYVYLLCVREREWVCVCTYVYKSDRVCVHVYEWVSEWVCECVSVCVWVSEWVSVSECEWVSEWVWVCVCVSEWVIDWVCVCVRERESVCVWVCECLISSE